MKVTLEKQEKNQVQLEVEVDQSQISAALNRVYRQIGQRVNIPGFRKGKAPRQIIERHVGPDYVKNETLDVLIPEAYSHAVEEAKIEPIAQPEVEVVRFEPTETLVFKAKVEVRPEVTLGNYTGIEIKMPEVTVSDDEVNKRIEDLRGRYATFVETDRAVQEGDSAVVDFSGEVEGKEIENGSAKDFKLEVTPGRFIPGFTESMVGMKPGETKTSDLKFPEDYPQKELAGKEAKFTITLHKVEERVLPAVDDEFAKTAKYENVEDMRTKLKEQLQSEAEENRQVELRRELIDKVIEGVQIEIPETMIKRELNFMIQQYARNIQSQGIDPQMVLTKEMVEKFEADTRPEAEKRIKTSLTLGAIARQENITVEENEVDEEVKAYATLYRTPFEQMKATLIQNGGYTSIADEVLSNKIIEWLLERANVAK